MIQRKNKMKIRLINLFIWILCFNFSCSYANQAFDPNQYRQFVESSNTFLYEDNRLVTEFQLSNQTQWYLSGDSLLTDKHFKSGTEVFIAPALIKDFDQRFWIHLENEDLSTTAWIKSSSKKFLPQLITKYKKLNKPAGWFSAAEYDYIVELSDGSKWLLVNEDGDIKADLKKWKQGEHLIVSSLEKTDFKEWYIINTDEVEFIRVDQKLQDLGYQKLTSIQLAFSVTPYLDNDSDLIKID